MLSERHIFFSFLCVVSRKKFLRDLGVSLISDNRDNNFVEPCLGLHGGGADGRLVVGLGAPEVTMAHIAHWGCPIIIFQGMKEGRSSLRLKHLSQTEQKPCNSFV